MSVVRIIRDKVAIGLNPVLQTEELPACISELDSRLSDMNTDNFSHFKFSLVLWFFFPSKFLQTKRKNTEAEEWTGTDSEEIRSSVGGRWRRKPKGATKKRKKLVRRRFAALRERLSDKSALQRTHAVYVLLFVSPDFLTVFTALFFSFFFTRFVKSTSAHVVGPFI